MKKLFLSIVFIGISLYGAVVEVKSSYDFKTTILKISENLQKNGYKIYTLINQKENAKSVGEYSSNSITIIFDNPKDTARIMMHDSKVAYALPQKLLIYENLDDEVVVYYEQFKDIKNKYEVKQCQIINRVSNRLDGIINNSIE